MPDSRSSTSISPPCLPILCGEREWMLEYVYRQQRLQRRHTACQTGHAMPRRHQLRLPVFRISDGFIFCAVGLLMKAVLTCSQTSNVIPPVIANGPPPHMIYDPSDRTSLPCTADGTMPLTYEWFKNGEKLEPNSNTAIQPDGGLTLNWQNNQNNSVEGYYQCKVRNTAGVAISNLTYLQAAVLNATGGRRVEQPIVQKAGQSLVLSCSHVIRSIPPDTKSWWLATHGSVAGDIAVTLDDRVIVAENGNLVFTYLQQSDSNRNGTFYKCFGYNPVTKREVGGSYYHLTVDGMQVEDEPELLYSSSSVVYALEGRPFNLSCLFGGLSTPIVEWVLPSGDTVVNNRLHVHSASLSDGGHYTCRGKTLRHTKEAYFQVIIDALPRVAAELKEQVATRGSTVRFHCPAVGRPNPAVSWFINGSLYNESSADDSLVFVDVQNSASISCNVSNKYGYHMRSTYLLIVDDVIFTTSSHGRRDDTSTPSANSTVTTKTTNAGSEAWNTPSSERRSFSIKGDAFSRSSGTKATNSETGRHTVSEDANIRGKLWFLVVLPVVCLVAGLIIAGLYCRHKRRQSYSLNDHESQRGLQARSRDADTNGDSDDSGYDDVSRKTKQLKQAKRLSDMPEVEQSYL